MSQGVHADELRRMINALYVSVDDPIVRTYLDDAFVALEDEPTSNADLSPAESSPIDFSKAIAQLDALIWAGEADVEQLSACRHALRSAECLWLLHESSKSAIRGIA